MSRVKLRTGRSSPGRGGSQPAQLQAKRDAAVERARDKAAANRARSSHDRRAVELEVPRRPAHHPAQRARALLSPQLTPYERELLSRAGVGHYGSPDLGAWVTVDPSPEDITDCGVRPQPNHPFFATRKLSGVTCPRCLVLTDLGQALGLLTLVDGELIDAAPDDPGRRPLRKKYLRARRASAAEVALTEPAPAKPGTLASLVPSDEEPGIKNVVRVTYSNGSGVLR